MASGTNSYKTDTFKVVSDVFGIFDIDKAATNDGQAAQDQTAGEKEVIDPTARVRAGTATTSHGSCV